MNINTKEINIREEIAKRKLEEQVFVYNDEFGNNKLRIIKNGKNHVAELLSEMEWIRGNTKGINIPFNLDKLVKLDNCDGTVFIVIGEENAIYLELLLSNYGYKDFVVTTNRNGINNWSHELNHYLEGYNVVAVFDNEGSRDKHMEYVVEQLNTVANSVKKVNLSRIQMKDKKVDVYDFIMCDGTGEMIIENAKSVKVIKQLPSPYYEKKGEIKVSTYDFAMNMIEKYSIKKYEDFIYVYDEKMGLYKRIYDKSGEGALGRLITNYDSVAQKIFKTGSKKQVASKIYDLCEELDEAMVDNPYSLNLRNGMYDLRKGSLYPHSHEYYTTTQLPYSYNEESSCNYFDSFIDDIMKDEKLKCFVQEIFGISVSSFNNMKTMYFFYGPPHTGKSTLLNALIELIGKRNVSNILMKDFEGKFKSAQLYGKKVNIDGDITIKSLDTIPTIKTITGGDWLNAQEKFIPSFDFKPFSKLIFAGNHLPDVTDVALWERLKVVEFNQIIDSENMSRDLYKEFNMEYLLKYAIQGLERLIRNGFNHTDCNYLNTIKNELYKEEHDIECFVDSHCELGPTNKIISKDAYLMYLEFCLDKDFIHRERNDFIISLKKKYSLTKKNIGKDNHSGYLGIKLKEVCND